MIFLTDPKCKIRYGCGYRSLQVITGVMWSYGGNRWLPVDTVLACGYVWLRVVAFGNGWLRVVTGGYGRLRVVTGGGQRHQDLLIYYTQLSNDLDDLTSSSELQRRDGVGSGAVSSRSFDLLNSMIY